MTTKTADRPDVKVVYSITEAARVYGFDPERIRRAVRSGALPAKQQIPGTTSKFRILATDLDAWFRNLPDA